MYNKNLVNFIINNIHLTGVLIFMKKGVILQNNFLNEVIFRIDFTTILKLSGNKKESAEDFQKKIFHEFPNVEIIHNNNFNIDIDIKSGLPKQFNSEDNLCWIFRNGLGDKEVSLTSNNLSYTCKNGSYNGFKLFLNDVLLILDALSVYKPFELKFLGLRYINQIDNPDINDDIDLYINDFLSNKPLIDDFADDEEVMSQIFTKFSIKKENYLLNLQYGFFNSDFPNPNHQKDFILDYDCVTQEIKAITDIEKHLKYMNQIIFDKFEYSIKDALIEKMGEKYGSSN